MEVVVTFMGPLAGFVGQGTVRFDLPEGAVYGDLLDDIGLRFGPDLPSRVWDARAKAFKPGILAVGAGRDLDSRETPLIGGEEIRIVPLVAGG